MENNLKVYVLTNRCGCEMASPLVYRNMEDAYNTMKTEYENVLETYDREEIEDNSIEGLGATIQTSGDWHEWIITDCSVR